MKKCDRDLVNEMKNVTHIDLAKWKLWKSEHLGTLVSAQAWKWVAGPPTFMGPGHPLSWVLLIWSVVFSFFPSFFLSFLRSFFHWFKSDFMINLFRNFFAIWHCLFCMGHKKARKQNKTNKTKQNETKRNETKPYLFQRFAEALGSAGALLTLKSFFNV